MKTIGVRIQPTPDGWMQPHIYGLVKMELQAQCAMSIANSMAGKVMNDTDDSGYVSPRRIASVACDIANALFEEFERREWMEELPQAKRVGE